MCSETSFWYKFSADFFHKSSPEYLLNFHADVIYHHTSRQFSHLQCSEYWKMYLSVKYLLCPLTKLCPKFLPSLPNHREITHPCQALLFLNLSPSRKGGEETMRALPLFLCIIIFYAILKKKKFSKNFSYPPLRPQSTLSSTIKIH